jgi:predicted dehydrogenase
MTSNPAKLARDDFSDVRRFESVEGVLADPEVDAVDICLPTDLHSGVAIAALRAGKHVLVEKPIALDAASAEAMRQEAERAGRVLMAGHVLRFHPAYRTLAEWVKDKKAISATFRRQCAEPASSAWLTDRERSGGPALDLLIHDLDFCVSLWGMPELLRAAGSGPGEVLTAQLFYPGRGPVEIVGGWYPSGDFPFSMEFAATTEAGTCEWAFPARIASMHRPDGEAWELPIEETDPVAAELRYFSDCVNEGRLPDLCPPAQSGQAVALARMILESRANDGVIVRVVRQTTR